MFFFAYFTQLQETQKGLKEDEKHVMPSTRWEKDFDEIKNKVILLFKEDLNGCKTFKFVLKRSDKNFVFSSSQIR